MMFRDNDHGVFMDTAWRWKIKVIILLALMKLLLILKYVHAPLNWEHNRVAPIKITSIRQSSGKCDDIFGQVAESLSMYRVVPLSSSAAVCKCPWQPQASTAILHSQCISPHPKKKRTNWLLQCRQSRRAAVIRFAYSTFNVQILLRLLSLWRLRLTDSTHSALRLADINSSQSSHSI